MLLIVDFKRYVLCYEINYCCLYIHKHNGMNRVELNPSSHRRCSMRTDIQLMTLRVGLPLHGCYAE
jgi:hypothetical protein